MKLKQGFTLIEFMIANVMTLMIILFLVSVYIRMRSTVSQIKTMAVLIENARFTSFLLSREIHNLKFGANSETIARIKGYRTKLPAYLKNQSMNNSDVLEINHYEQGKIYTTAFFVAKTARKSTQGKEIYALYQKLAGGHREELVTGIENMAIEFGVACADLRNICQYCNADEITSWDKVLSLHLIIGLVSELNYFSKAYAYYFNNKLCLPDKRLHKEWHIYLAIPHARNNSS